MQIECAWAYAYICFFLGTHMHMYVHPLIWYAYFPSSGSTTSSHSGSSSSNSSSPKSASSPSSQVSSFTSHSPKIQLVQLKKNDAYWKGFRQLDCAASKYIKFYLVWLVKVTFKRDSRSDKQRSHCSFTWQVGTPGCPPELRHKLSQRPSVSLDGCTSDGATPQKKIRCFLVKTRPMHTYIHTHIYILHI